MTHNKRVSVPRAFFGSLAAVLLVTSLVGCSGCSNEPTNGTSNGSSSGETFDIGMVTFAGYAPLYLAKEKGFFGDLNVELHRIEEVASIRAGVTNGNLEAYLATPDIALDSNTKPPGVAVWAIDESAGGDGVVVSGEIDDLNGLKGKKVAAEPGLPPYFVLLYLLHQNGLSLNDIDFQDMTTQDASTAFVSKSVDAAGVYEPYLSTAERQRAGSKIVISSAQTPGLIVDLIFVHEDQIESNKGNIQKVIEGWRQAMEFIRESPDEANAIMSKAFNLPVDEFKDIVSGIKWLDLEENRELFGTADAPGPLFANFVVVRGVLQRNRPEVYNALAEEHLSREFIKESN